MHTQAPEVPQRRSRVRFHKVGSSGRHLFTLAHGHFCLVEKNSREDERAPRRLTCMRQSGAEAGVRIKFSLSTSSSGYGTQKYGAFTVTTAYLPDRSSEDQRRGQKHTCGGDETSPSLLEQNWKCDCPAPRPMHQCMWPRRVGSTFLIQQQKGHQCGIIKDDFPFL